MQSPTPNFLALFRCPLEQSQEAGSGCGPAHSPPALPAYVETDRGGDLVKPLCDLLVVLAAGAFGKV